VTTTAGGQQILADLGQRGPPVTCGDQRRRLTSVQLKYAVSAEGRFQQAGAVAGRDNHRLMELVTCRGAARHHLVADSDQQVPAV